MCVLTAKTLRPTEGNGDFGVPHFSPILREVGFWQGKVEKFVTFYK
jgi:hypothetical protein